MLKYSIIDIYQYKQGKLPPRPDNISSLTLPLSSNIITLLQCYLFHKRIIALKLFETLIIKHKQNKTK